MLGCNPKFSLVRGDAVAEADYLEEQDRWIEASVRLGVREKGRGGDSFQFWALQVLQLQVRPVAAAPPSPSSFS